MKDIKIKNNSGLLKIRLNDLEDKPILDNKGEEVYWTFDLRDIELVGIWSEVVEVEEKLKRDLNSRLLIIDKKQDVKGKYSNSKNMEDSLQVYKDYYDKEIANINRFLGENGVEKFLNGRKPYWNMFSDVASAIEQILPLFEDNVESFKKEIKEKYGEIDNSILE